MAPVGKDGPIRVTELINCLGIGGTERQLVELVRWLDPSEFAVDLCCLQKVGEFLPVVRERGYEPTEFHLRGTLYRPNTLMQIQRLAHRLRATGAQLVHCHDFYSNLIGAAAAQVAGIPFILSRRDTGAWIDWKRTQVLKILTRHAPRVLTNAYAIRDQLMADEGVRSDRITVVHNGLDLAEFDRQAAEPLVSPMPDIIERRPVVVMTGNMKHPVKGHAELLVAAAAVLRAEPECRFLLIGDGALRPALEKRAQTLGISESVLFAGKRTDVPALLSRSQVAVCSSRAEGLSNAIMEAMAARLPVVATAVGGNIELVRDGRTGYVTPKGEALRLAERIVELLRDPKRARQMGRIGRRRIEEGFSAAHMAEHVSSLYREMLGLPRGLRHAA